MTLHVLFTPEGIPGWIGSEPREGSEPIEDDLSIEFLAAHRRTEKGEWVKRDPVVVPPPTAEAIAGRLAARKAAIIEGGEAEVRAKLIDWLVDWAMGTITVAQLRARIVALRAEVKALADAEK